MRLELERLSNVPTVEEAFVNVTKLRRLCRKV
jgi:hypothetical protein